MRGCLAVLLATPLFAAHPCARCHPAETSRFLASKMGNSIHPPGPRPAGNVTHAPSGSVIEIRERAGKMYHRLTEKGFTAEYAVDYEIGAGLFGGSFLVRIGDEFVQSPVSWYNSHGWDVSPGYASLPVIDFNRSVNDACLLCHTGNTVYKDVDGRRIAGAAPVPISCERCHGPAERHLRRPVPGSIVNPAKLSGRVRESICAQCHLEGAARVLNPGMAFSDFHPGEDLGQVRPVYVNSDAETSGNVVNHFEQLEQSRCYRESGGKMWCGTCHDPHGPPANRTAQMHAICTSCHTTLSKQAHPPEQRDCLSCHMPRSAASDVPHAAITDHRILRRPATPASGAVVPRSIRAWTEPPAEDRDRDLAMANILVGIENRSAPLVEAGAELLERMLSSTSVADAPALSSLAAALASEGRFQDAAAMERRAAGQQPDSADDALNLGLYLAEMGDAAAAERELKRSISLDPFFDRPYKALFDLDSQRNQTSDAIATLDRYLKQNPQSIEFRIERAVAAAGE